MKTYIAQIETPSGYQHTQLAAMNIQDAQAQLEARVKNGGETEARYSIQEQSPALAPEATSALLNASGGLLACLVILVIAEYRLRRHFKG
jgi:hypothetical protein